MYIYIYIYSRVRVQGLTLDVCSCLGGTKLRGDGVGERANQLDRVETTGAARARTPVAENGAEEGRTEGREAATTVGRSGTSDEALRRMIKEEGGGAAEPSETRCHPHGADMVGRSTAREKARKGGGTTSYLDRNG